MVIAMNITTSFILGSLMTASLLSSTFAQGVLVSDFKSLNPLTLPQADWATPVSQIQPFNDGGITGQEVTSIGGGNPTGFGGALTAFFAPLNLSGQSSLTLSLRVQPGNQVTTVQVALFSDNDNQSAVWQPTISLSDSGFQTIPLDLSRALPGTTLDFGHVTRLGIGGLESADQQVNPFRMQFASLVAVPEPSTLILGGLAVVGFVAWKGLTPRRNSQTSSRGLKWMLGPTLNPGSASDN